MIFYFSATGNSRYVAERIAAATGNTAISITECRKRQSFAFACAGESVGIVTPTYAWGLPSVVREFLQELELAAKPNYLWLVATYGTTPGQTGHFANDILRRKGLSLSARFSVKMPDTWTPLFDLSDKDEVARINEAAQQQIDSAIEKIQAQTCGDFMERKMPWLLSRAVHRFEYESMRKTSHFIAEDGCIGCGLCSRNCPVSAIAMQDKKPVWVTERCAMCLSCLHRCPKFAIQYGKRTKQHGQYVHPSFKDGLLKK